MYKCVCVCVCVHLYRPAIGENDMNTHHETAETQGIAELRDLPKLCSSLYVEVNASNNVLYHSGGYTLGSAIAGMESEKPGRFV